MIGNDLIDLSHWPIRLGRRRERYLAKVFTEWEQEWIRYSGTPYLTEAWLWSLKEAAYKLERHSQASRRWSPKEYGCKPPRCGLLPSKGVMQIGQRQLCFSSSRNAKELHTVVWPCDLNLGSPSWQVQDQRPDYLPQTNVRLRKDSEGRPYGCRGSLYIPCSRSHDGGRHALAWIPGSGIFEGSDSTSSRGTRRSVQVQISP